MLLRASVWTDDPEGACTENALYADSSEGGVPTPRNVFDFSTWKALACQQARVSRKRLYWLGGRSEFMRKTLPFVSKAFGPSRLAGKTRCYNSRISLATSSGETALSPTM